MRRLAFITLLVSGAAVAWPPPVSGQQAPMPVVGVLSSQSQDSEAAVLAAWHQALNETGYVGGRNVALEYRFADGHAERLPMLATDLVRRQVTVLMANTTPPSFAAKAATETIPIVFVTGVDPVEVGLVASFNRPGANVTGVTFLSNKLVAKRLELLAALVSGAAPIGMLAHTRNPNTASDVSQQFESEQENTSVLHAAAAALGQQIIVLECRSDRDMETALAALVQRKVGALIVGLFPLAWNNRHKILEAAAKHRIPAIYPEAAFVSDGGLMSYAAGRAIYRKVAVDYVGKILSGANPADLPIQRPTTFELVINLKAAKALDLEVPLTLLAIADEVIE